MDDFSSHIGIIGGGIAGFTLGCTLKKYGINTVIFEKESNPPNPVCYPLSGGVNYQQFKKFIPLSLITVGEGMTKTVPKKN